MILNMNTAMLKVMPSVSEPPGALRDVAMSQWEDKAVVTVRATVLTAGLMRMHVNGAPVCAAGFRLAAAAGVHSSLGFVSGDLRVVAGEPATALVELSDGLGRRLPRGGAKLRAALIPTAASAPAAGAAAETVAPTEVTVTDRGNGLYELRFALTRNGCYALRAALTGDDEPAADAAAAASEARCAVTCAPCAASPEHFEADASALGTWAAGEAGKLVIVRRDRHGNWLTGAGCAPTLRASLDGAGPAEAATAEAGDGRVVVTCLAHVAGAYMLHVSCSASGSPVAGSPFQVCPAPRLPCS